MSNEQRILTGASSISAINFIAPLYHDFFIKDKEVYCFINDSVKTSSADISIFSESSRGSLPLPIIVKTSRKSVTQGFLPLFEGSKKTTLGNAYQSKKIFIDKLIFWFDFHLNIIPKSYIELRERIIKNKRKILNELDKTLIHFPKEISVSEFSLLLIKIFTEHLSPNTKYRYTYCTLKEFMTKFSIEEINMHIYLTVKNFLVKDDYLKIYKFPFNGFIQIKYKEKSIDFYKVSLSSQGLVLYNDNNEKYRLILINSSLKLIINDSFAVDGFELKCSGSLSAELIARVAKAIVAPWYLPTKKTSSNEKHNTSNACFEEYISPLKASSIGRRSSDIGGGNNRLFPSGYILMDYSQKTIRQWISTLLRLEVNDNESIYKLFKQLSYLNFSSRNQNSTLFSRANTISKIILKNNYTSLSYSNIKYTLYYKNIINFEYDGEKLKDDYLTEAIDLISFFNHINSSLYNEKLNKNNFHEHIDTLKLSNLAMNILNIIELTDKHIELISFKNNSIINYLIREKKINFTKHFISLKEIKKKETLISELEEYSVLLEFNRNDLQEDSLRVMRLFLNFFNSYFTGLIVYWNVFNVYCLKASLPNLSLLLTDKEFSQSMNQIMEQRGSLKSLKFISSWNQSH